MKSDNRALDITEITKDNQRDTSSTRESQKNNNTGFDFEFEPAQSEYQHQSQFKQNFEMPAFEFTQEEATILNSAFSRRVIAEFNGNLQDAYRSIYRRFPNPIHVEAIKSLASENLSASEILVSMLVSFGKNAAPFFSKEKIENVHSQVL